MLYINAVTEIPRMICYFFQINFIENTNKRILYFYIESFRVYLLVKITFCYCLYCELLFDIGILYYHNDNDIENNDGNNDYREFYV